MKKHIFVSILLFVFGLPRFVSPQTISLSGLNIVKDGNSQRSAPDKPVALETGYEYVESVPANYPPVFYITENAVIAVEAGYLANDVWGADNRSSEYMIYQTVSLLDFSSNDVLSENEIHSLLQWIQNNGTQQNYHFKQLLDKALMGHAEIRLNAVTDVSVKSIINFQSGDWYVQPGINWTVTKEVGVGVAMDLFNGKGSSFSTINGDNDQIQFKFAYSF